MSIYTDCLYYIIEVSKPKIGMDIGNFDAQYTGFYHTDKIRKKFGSYFSFDICINNIKRI